MSLFQFLLLRHWPRCCAGKLLFFRFHYVFRRTLFVDGGLVSEFPWQESFKTGTIPDAWSLAPLEGTADWQIMSGMGVSGAAIQGAAEGRYNAVFRA